MTQYVVDGEIGAMVTSQESPSANMVEAISSVKRMDAEQEVSLTLPTQLDFWGITWRIRFPDTFTRAFRDRDLKQQQPDAFIDGWTGYARSGSWFTFQDRDNEWFEVHGAVDGAWWQFLFQGRDRALFTDGAFSVEVELEANAWYYVAMVFGNGIVTIRLSDGSGTTLASNSQSGVTIPLSKSYLGASAMVYNIVADREPATITDDTIQLYGEVIDFDGSEGYVYWPSHDAKTQNVGTTAGYYAWPWTDRPWWASECEGLEYTYGIHKTACAWFRLYTDGAVPAKYDNANGYLEYWPKIQCNDRAIGQAVESRLSTGWPTAWTSGIQTGIYVFVDELWEPRGPFYAPVEGYIDEGRPFHVSLQPEQGDRAAVPPWYTCGTGFDWPDATGAGNSWASWYTDPDEWEFYWTLTPQDGGNPSFEIDEIVLDADIDASTGDLITEDTVVMEGWNTEMLPVEDGIFTIDATPVRGSVNVYTWDGKLLDYPDEWEEADDLGLRYRLKTEVEGDAVTVIYFVTRPVHGNEPAISRPTMEAEYQERPRKTRTPYPM